MDGLNHEIFILRESRFLYMFYIKNITNLCFSSYVFSGFASKTYDGYIRLSPARQLYTNNYIGTNDRYENSFSVCVGWQWTTEQPAKLKFHSPPHTFFLLKSCKKIYPDIGDAHTINSRTKEIQNTYLNKNIYNTSQNWLIYPPLLHSQSKHRVKTLGKSTESSVLS